MNVSNKNNSDGIGFQAAREYSNIEELLNNLPYIAMIVLGTMILVVGFTHSAVGWALGMVYFIYGVAGAFWIILFLCLHCYYWDTRSCPCGYGHIAAKFRAKQASDHFGEKFKKHIPVIVPLWFIPILVGIPLVVRSFPWLLLALVSVFVLHSFIVLPLVSIKHSCKGCPQKGACPWMRRKSRSSSLVRRWKMDDGGWTKVRCLQIFIL